MDRTAVAMPPTMQVAIYDLDKTLVRQATFTPFLVFAARRVAPWRLALLPVWIVLMIGHKAGFYQRTWLKTAGMRLMLGRVSVAHLEALGREFAPHHIARKGWMEGIRVMVRQDQAEGTTVAIATAAFEFYARAFADLLGIETVIATLWDGASISGGNCYGDEKARRVQTWFDTLGASEMPVALRFVSDSFADAPLLEQAQDAVFVTANAGKREIAERKGWTVVSGQA